MFMNEICHSEFIIEMCHSVQADYAVLDAFIPNVPTYRADRSIILFDADIHDLQRLAMLCRGDRCRHRLFLIWLEKISGR